jgi:hypothetical protein
MNVSGGSGVGMKRWQRWTRLAVIAAASFVLLVTVLPQVASGIGLPSLGARLAATSSCSSGSSGSSGIGSSGQCGPGTVTGSVTVTGAPTGFSPAYLGAGACPASTPTGMACANPQYALALGGKYSLSLAAGTWEVSGFYENGGLDGVFLSAAQFVTVPSGGTVTENFAVPYQSPATLKGTIQVTGVPSGITVDELSVLLCPSFAPYTGGFPSIACVTGYGQGSFGLTSAPFQINGLPPGQWSAYPGYCTQFGCDTNANAGKKVNLVAGGTKRVKLTTPFLVPSQGQLSATVTVTGAPAGFADPLGISACQLGGGYCQTYFGFGSSTISVILPNGQWTLQGQYLVPPFDNAVTGPSQVVTISGGHTTAVSLDVPYQVLGGVTGTIRVTGKASGVPITSYTVVACPASSGGRTSPECINEYSGPGGLGFTNALTRRSNGAARAAAAPVRTPFNLYQLSTLTPGRWTLYPGYGTAFGSYTDPVGTTVSITAGQTITQRLSVPYQIPAAGLVTGKVTAIGVPQSGFQTGVQGCTAPPTGTSCPGEQFAYTNSDGTYTLSLPPGTWWVSGFVDVFGGFSENETTSAPQQLTVVAGSRTKVNFTVKGTTSS